MNILDSLTQLTNETDICKNHFSENDTTTTSFAETPIMSTYLIAFVVSDFPFMFNTSNSNVFRHRIFSKPTDQRDTKFALKTGERLFDALKSYLNVNYTLPKIDHVAIPGFQHGVGGTIAFKF